MIANFILSAFEEPQMIAVIYFSRQRSGVMEAQREKICYHI